MSGERQQGMIMKALGGFYYVACPQLGEAAPVECRARGVFRQQNKKPCVGDQVVIQVSQDSIGYILELLPRKNSLVRPPLANLDQLLLVVSIADPPPNTLVLDKLIAIAEYQHIQPAVVVTKCDLGDTRPFAGIYRQAGLPVYVASSLTGEGVEAVRQALAGRCSAFCGNTGAGKSSLLNAIDSRLCLNTGDISRKLGRGRHTTRHVELFPVEGGGFVADTPGFSAVDLERFQLIRKEELQHCFREFEPFLGQCQFTGCSHTKEKGCAVCRAVEEGRIAPSRHQSYLALYQQAKQMKEWEQGR